MLVYFGYLFIFDDGATFPLLTHPLNGLFLSHSCGFSAPRKGSRCSTPEGPPPPHAGGEAARSLGEVFQAKLNTQELQELFAAVEVDVFGAPLRRGWGGELGGFWGVWGGAW